MPRPPRAGILALVLGGAIATVAQLASPIGVPVYNGVVVQDPYRFLEPGEGQSGDPASFSSEPGLDNGKSRAFVAATTENPPQAQLIALPGAMVPPAGATTMRVSIGAVAPITPPTSGTIVGNVYRFEVTDGSGAPFTVASGGRPTLTLRAPENVTTAQIGHLTDAGWQLLATDHGGALALFATEPAELGDYAVIVSGAAQKGPDALTIAVVGATIGIPVVVGIALFLRRRREATLAAEAVSAARARSRVPSKRRAPPGGRTGRRGR